MIVVARTDSYTIFKKRNQRFAVRRNATREWLQGGDKAAVLLAHNLVPNPTIRAPDHPEAPSGDALPAAEISAADAELREEDVPD
jgi:hypothetical protein